MTQNSMLHVRVDEEVKTQATQALTAMGMSVSEAVRIFLKRVVTDQAFPLELRVPNAVTQTAMRESREMMKSGKAGHATAGALFHDLEKTGQA